MEMKTMKIISFIICGLGILGGLIFLTEGNSSDAIFALLVYGFFLALTLKIK
jgi:hypothetical protein